MAPCALAHFHNFPPLDPDLGPVSHSICAEVLRVSLRRNSVSAMSASGDVAQQWPRDREEAKRSVPKEVQFYVLIML